MEIVRKIGGYKKNLNLMALQFERWEQMQEQRCLVARSAGLNPDFTKKLFTLIHEESLNIQTDIMTGRQQEGMQKN